MGVFRRGYGREDDVALLQHEGHIAHAEAGIFKNVAIRVDGVHLDIDRAARHTKGGADALALIDAEPAADGVHDGAPGGNILGDGLLAGDAHVQIGRAHV